jgi:hypothetical protein
MHIIDVSLDNIYLVRRLLFKTGGISIAGARLCLTKEQFPASLLIAPIMTQNMRLRPPLTFFSCGDPGRACTSSHSCLFRCWKLAPNFGSIVVKVEVFAEYIAWMKRAASRPRSGSRRYTSVYHRFLLLRHTSSHANRRRVPLYCEPLQIAIADSPNIRPMFPELARDRIPSRRRHY